MKNMNYKLTSSLSQCHIKALLLALLMLLLTGCQESQLQAANTSHAGDELDALSQLLGVETVNECRSQSLQHWSQKLEEALKAKRVTATDEKVLTCFIVQWDVQKEDWDAWDDLLSSVLLVLEHESGSPQKYNEYLALVETKGADIPQVAVLLDAIQGFQYLNKAKLAAVEARKTGVASSKVKEYSIKYAESQLEVTDFVLERGSIPNFGQCLAFNEAITPNFSYEEYTTPEALQDMVELLDQGIQLAKKPESLYDCSLLLPAYKAAALLMHDDVLEVDYAKVEALLKPLVFALDGQPIDSYRHFKESKLEDVYTGARKANIFSQYAWTLIKLDQPALARVYLMQVDLLLELPSKVRGVNPQINTQYVNESGYQNYYWKSLVWLRELDKAQFYLKAQLETADIFKGTKSGVRPFYVEMSRAYGKIVEELRQDLARASNNKQRFSMSAQSKQLLQESAALHRKLIAMTPSELETYNIRYYGLLARSIWLQHYMEENLFVFALDELKQCVALAEKYSLAELSEGSRVNASSCAIEAAYAFCVPYNKAEANYYLDLYNKYAISENRKLYVNNLYERNCINKE